MAAIASSAGLSGAAPRASIAASSMYEGVEVADLARVGAGRGLGRRLLDQLGGALGGELGDDGADAVRGAIGRDLGAIEPAAVGVGEEVGAGRDAGFMPARSIGRAQRAQRAARTRRAARRSGRRGAAAGAAATGGRGGCVGTGSGEERLVEQAPASSAAEVTSAAAGAASVTRRLEAWAAR